MSKSGDNIGLVWSKIYTSKQSQFEDVTIIPSSHAQGHPCLVSLLFMVSLYSTLFLLAEFFIYLLTFGSHAYSTWSVCLFVFVNAHSGTTGYEAAYDSFRTTYANLKNKIPETTVFEMKTSEKANMHNRTGLPDLLAQCTRSHDEGLSTLACYLLV